MTAVDVDFMMTVMTMTTITIATTVFTVAFVITTVFTYYSCCLSRWSCSGPHLHTNRQMKCKLATWQVSVVYSALHIAPPCQITMKLLSWPSQASIERETLKLMVLQCVAAFGLS